MDKHSVSGKNAVAQIYVADKYVDMLILTNFKPREPTWNPSRTFPKPTRHLHKINLEPDRKPPDIHLEPHPGHYNQTFDIYYYFIQFNFYKGFFYLVIKAGAK